MLRFDGGQNYYALDGQHRVTAIQTLLSDSDQRDRLGISVPEGFGEEEISVIIMTTTGSEKNGKKSIEDYFHH